MTPRKHRRRYWNNALRISLQLGRPAPKTWEQVWALLDEHGEPEYLYAIVDHERTLVKLGRSTAPTTRLHQLQTAQGKPLRLWAFCEHVSPFTEKEVHGRLREYRENGEWFRLTPEVRRTIDAMRENGTQNYVRIAGAK